MTEDDQLMIRIQSGDDDAFAELVEQYEGPLFGFFLRNVRDRQFAEDLTQDTLLKLYRQSWDYLPVGKFRSWMFRIARNLMIDNIRKRARDALIKAVKGQRDDEDDALARLAGEVMLPDELANQQELSQLVDELLQQIPDEQRVTFTLHHYSGLTLAEVAEVTNTPLPTCKSRLRLAREKLRERLIERGIADPVQSEGM